MTNQGSRSLLGIPLLGVVAVFGSASAWASPTFTRLWSFKGSNGAPYNLALHDGRLYGGLSYNAEYPTGAVFELTRSKAHDSWVRKVIYAGTDTISTPVFDEQGAMYGSTFLLRCGAANSLCFTIFQLTPSAGAGAWTYAMLYQFPIFGYESGPDLPTLIYRNGFLYGAVPPASGYGNYGIVFQLSPPASASAAWTATTLYQFSGGTDGRYPSSLVADSSGNLYGTTVCGGAAVCDYDGTVFELIPPTAPGGNWTETTLHTFGGPGDGYWPHAMIFGSDGALYGTTYAGGGEGACDGFQCGVVFRLSPPAASGGAWTESILHSFSGADGAEPATLAIDDHSNIYGGTFSGGDSKFCFNGCGMVFQLSQSGGNWTYTTIHEYTQHGDDAGGPCCMVLDLDGSPVAASGYYNGLVSKFASSAKFVGRFRFWQPSKIVI